jgi:tetratricopeptide (TPR) repeat protein
VACSSRYFLPARAGDHYAPAGWLLAEYRVTLAAHLGVHRGELRRTNRLCRLSPQQDRVEEAGAYYRAALAILPDGPTATLGLGDYEERRGHLPEAIARYEMVARRAADAGSRATGYNRLGFAYRQMGESKKAKQCFETALHLVPNRARAMTGLGLIAQENGDLPEAIRQYESAIATEPTDVGYLLLAQALRLQGRSEEATAISERVAGSSLNLAEAQKAVAAFLSRKEARSSNSCGKSRFRWPPLKLASNSKPA